jgi:serine/threonine protein kinase
MPASPSIDGLTLSPPRGSGGKKQPGRSLETKEAPKGIKFEEDYKLHQKISKGSFGIVYVAEHLASGEEYAVKIIERKRLAAKDTIAVEREVKILMDCADVEHIVRMVDFYESPTSFYVVQVYARGGDVFERLATRTSYTEKDARFLAIHLIKAMEVLHSRKMAHRDLKPENLLLSDMFDDSGILLADFGFACYVPEEKLTTRCGTPAFVAPEVLVPDCRYDESCDMWSVGCLLYMLLGGYPPFQDKNHRGLFRKIRGADFCFHDAYWKNVSISAKQLISSLLTVDPVYRCTAKMALENSSWLKLEDLSLSENDLSASIGEIKKFQARQQLKGAMHAVRWSVRAKFMSRDITSFLKQIKVWDKDDEAIQGSKDSLLTEDRPTLEFADVYEMKEKVHTGKSSTIWECIRKQDGEKLAVKVVERVGDPAKSATGKSAAETVLHELAVLKSLKHKYIIDIIDFFDEDDSFYLVMERMEGGDVFDRIMDMKQYTEKDARDLSRALIEAVACMHQSGIAHRDLKPQNLLLKSKEDNSDIKLADFGFACKVHTPQSLTTRCGTVRFFFVLALIFTLKVVPFLTPSHFSSLANLCGA